MKDIDLALADISNIRSHLNASTCFQGIAPHFHTLTGVLVFFVALYQHQNPMQDGLATLWVWMAVLVVIGAFAVQKAITRSIRMHGSMAKEMLFSVCQQVLPFFAAGIVFTLVITRHAPDIIWILPGTWHILIGILGFSIMTRLPQGIIYASYWYFIAGACVLWIGTQTHSLSPWMMGIPLSVGQILVGVMLSYNMRRR